MQPLKVLFKLFLFNLLIINYLSAKDWHKFYADSANQGKNDTIVPQSTEAKVADGKEESVLKLDKAVLLRDSLVNFAKTFRGTPYVWGGTTPRGFDCSGYAQYIYKKFGFDLPRMSGDQSRLGKTVSPADAQPGDLVYYGYPYNKTWVFTHTALIYSNDKKYGLRAIHATLWGVQITGVYFDPNWRVICIKRLIE
jgi:cell wall-associated NlpC family hydrolase